MNFGYSTDHSVIIESINVSFNSFMHIIHTTFFYYFKPLHFTFGGSFALWETLLILIWKLTLTFYKLFAL